MQAQWAKLFASYGEKEMDMFWKIYDTIYPFLWSVLAGCVAFLAGGSILVIGSAMLVGLLVGFLVQKAGQMKNWLLHQLGGSTPPTVSVKRPSIGKKIAQFFWTGVATIALTLGIVNFEGLGNYDEFERAQQNQNNNDAIVEQLSDVDGDSENSNSNLIPGNEATTNETVTNQEEKQPIDSDPTLREMFDMNLEGFIDDTHEFERTCENKRLSSFLKQEPTELDTCLVLYATKKIDNRSDLYYLIIVRVGIIPTGLNQSDALNELSETFCSSVEGLDFSGNPPEKCSGNRFRNESASGDNHLYLIDENIAWVVLVMTKFYPHGEFPENTIEILNSYSNGRQSTLNSFILK